MSSLIFRDNSIPSITDFFGNKFLGFDNTFSAMDAFLDVDFKDSNFPPYNMYIVDADNNSELFTKNDSGKHTYIEVALAGIRKEDISVQLTDKNILTITNDKEELPDREAKCDSKAEIVKWLHKGIAERTFKLSWTINKGTKLGLCKMTNGILTIVLYTENEVSKTRYIEIK